MFGWSTGHHNPYNHKWTKYKELIYRVTISSKASYDTNDEDINTSVTIIPSVEILGPITW
jgi:hypothetical protein